VCTCSKKSPSEGLYWTLSKFFAKVDDLDSALESALENEDYELAVMLRDLNKALAE
jgi:protein-arginine kinase activator protein McsA